MKKIDVKEFWNWFVENEDKLMDIDNIDKEEAQDLMEEFETVLGQYSEGLSFEIGDLGKNGRDIIFSAEGDPDYFDDVIELFEESPSLDFWTIIPFRQGKGGRVIIEFEGYRYNSKDLWFIPLESEDSSDSIGLRIGVSDYDEYSEDQEIAIYTLIETMVGEFECSTLLEYFELIKLPDNPEGEGYINLSNLPEYFAWFWDNRNKE